MKHVLFMVGTMGLSFAAGFVEPVLAFLPYYLFAVLQPHELWDWALPSGVRWSMAAAAMGLLFVVLHAPSLWGRVRLWPVPALLGVYAALLVFSTLTAFDSATATSWATTVLKTLLIAGIVSATLSRWTHVAAFAGAILLGTAILAWHFNSLYLLEGRMDLLFRGLGALDNNGAALSMLVGLPFAYAFAFGVRAVWLRGLAVVAGGLIVHAVMLSYSRGAMLAGLIGMGWIAAHHRPRRHLLWGLPLVAVALSVLAGAEVREEFATIYRDHEVDASIQSRINSWGVAWEMAWQQPVTGMGPRNSNLYSYNFGADRVGRTVHNQYLQLAADAGIPAALTYIAILACGLLGARRARRVLFASADRGEALDAPVDSRLAAHLCLGIEAAIITFAVAAMFLSLETFEVILLVAGMGAAAPWLAERSVSADAAEAPSRAAGSAARSAGELPRMAPAV